MIPHAFTWMRCTLARPWVKSALTSWIVPGSETRKSKCAGSRFGPRTIGHTGWTGTSLWIDPDRGVFVALLTNRAYAPRSREPLTLVKRVRGRLADAVAEASDARR